MTGIERLRRLARSQNMDNAWTVMLAHELCDIADQIEREADVETVRSDAMRAWEWVREHGGLGHVMAEWCSRVPFEKHEQRRRRLLDHIAECETALGRRNVRIDELGHRVNDLMRENAELRKRAMPEGYEWDGSVLRILTAENVDYDGEPLEVGQTVWLVDSFGRPNKEREVSEILRHDRDLSCTIIKFTDGYSTDCGNVTHERPVLDAEGNRIEPAMDVWWVCEGDERGVHAERLHVESIGEDGLVTCDPFNGGTWVELEPSELYVNRPVLDADGVPIKVGDTVYFTDGREHECDTVVHAKYDYKGEPYVQLGRLNEAGYPTYTNCSCIDPSQLTHTKPEPPDSWERIEEDSTLSPEVYCHRNGIDISQKDGTEIFLADTVEPMARDLVRRCRALAERERGE